MDFARRMTKLFAIRIRLRDSSTALSRVTTKPYRDMYEELNRLRTTIVAGYCEAGLLSYAGVAGPASISELVPPKLAINKFAF
jgi:hypothetical protein